MGKIVLLASKGVSALKVRSLTQHCASLGFVFSLRGQKNEPWKNPQIKVRLETEQRIAKRERQAVGEGGERRNRHSRQYGERKQAE